MEEPLISIVTITYNAESTLPPTLKSVKEQTFRNFEHIIIDGASKDNTLEIIRGESYPQLKYVSEPDKGLYYAMNKGLRAASGKYLLFLNAGDTFHSPDTLSDYAKAAESDPDIIYGDTIIVDKDRNFISPRHLSAPARLTFKSFANGMLVCHQAFMTRRSLAPEYDTSYRFSADYDWTVKCLKNSDPDKNINLNEVTIDYLSDGLTDKNRKASLKERFHIMTSHYGYLPTVTRHIFFLFRACKRKILK